MAYLVRHILRMATIDKHVCVQSFDFTIGCAADLGEKNRKLISTQFK